MNCSKCMKSVEEGNFINCTSSSCKKIFCAICINISSYTGDRKKSWICPDCSAAQKKGGDTLSVRSGSEYVTNRKKTDSAGSDITTRKKTDSTGSDINTNQLTEQLRMMSIQLSSVMTKLDDVTESLAYNNERLDEMMLKFKAADERIKYLEKRDKELETLQASMMQLQNELKTQAQYNLRNEIEIAGIPENVAENLHHTMLVAARKIGTDLDINDIDWVNRVGPRRSPISTALPEDGAIMPRPVVVRFLRRIKRDQFMKAAKARKNINSTDLELGGTPRKVFFNERLTKENRMLFRDARIRSKEHGYAYCWCIHGSIYVRQREGKSAVLIQSHKDLDRLVPPLPNKE